MRAWILVLCLALAACTFRSARDELADLMDREIGRTSSDPDGYRARHPNLSRGARKLSNGHLEEEWRAGFRDNCPVFFEVEPGSGKALTWRFGLPDADCYLIDPAEEKRLRKPPAKK